jgi:hypothetical protein
MENFEWIILTMAEVLIIIRLKHDAFDLMLVLVHELIIDGTAQTLPVAMKALLRLHNGNQIKYQDITLEMLNFMSISLEQWETDMNTDIVQKTCETIYNSFTLLIIN